MSVENHLFPDVTGVILAGGKSRRMGRDKATLEFRGRTLFAGVLAMMRTLFPAVRIAGDRPDLALPDVPCLLDDFPGSALGGLYTGLRTAATEWIFVAPCDLPAPDPELARRILRQRTNVDAVVPRTGKGFEPLFAAYRKSCLPPMRDLLEAGNFRIYDFYPRVRVACLEPPELPPDWRQSLFNVNAPEDLALLRKTFPKFKED
ncbi:MAG: molybdenum cofactor guanylyltransferase [Desulfuromonadales bacterium]